MAGECRCDGCGRKVDLEREFCSFCGAPQKQRPLVLCGPTPMYLGAGEIGELDIFEEEVNFITAAWEDAGKS